jgi:hypothetical protein
MNRRSPLAPETEETKMKNPFSLTVFTLLLAVSSLSAATHHVSLESTNPTPPHTSTAYLSLLTWSITPEKYCP